MAAIKFSKQYIEPNPNEIDYWVDLSSNQYGGRMKYHNGFEWVDLVNPDGTHIDINDFYNKLQINQMLSQKASVDSVESKVDDDEVSDVIKNISFSQRGEDGVEMVMFKYDDTTVGIQLPIADNTKSGIITKDTFKNLVNQTQLQQLYSEMYTKLSEIRNNYQPKLRAGANIKIENNVISAVSKIGTDWNDIANKPDIYDKSQVDTMMSGVYKIKGSRRFEALPLYGNAVGDTYNITNDFSLHGEDYPMGTNVVWTENGWDALAGIFDTSELEEDIQEVKDNYLPLTGGIIGDSSNTYPLALRSGGSQISIPLITTKGTYYLGYDANVEQVFITDKGWTKKLYIWHEGNDGEGSGLDADLLGGIQSSQYVKDIGWISNTDLNSLKNCFTCVDGGTSSINAPDTHGNVVSFKKMQEDGYGGLQLFGRGNALYYRNYWDNKWGDWKGLAFTSSDITGNAATATQLKINEFELNDDLNDFINDGVYVSTRTDVVGSLLNAPNTVVKGEVRLDVKTFGSSRHLKQTLNLKNQNYQRVFYRFKYANEWSEWKTIATTDSNVASATKLSTPVKLWGNDFDGSGDIPVTSIGQMQYLSFTGVDLKTPVGYIGRGSSGTNDIILGTNAVDANIMLFSGGNTLKNITIKNNGNVGIGTNDPLYKLDVIGNTKSAAFIAKDENGTTIVYPWGLDVKADNPGITFFFGKSDTQTLRLILHSADRLTCEGGFRTTASIESGGHIYIPNNDALTLYDTKAVPHRSMMIGIDNTLLIGHDSTSAGYPTYIDGNNLYFRYGTTHTNGIILNSSGNVTIGEADLANTKVKLYVNGTTVVDGYVYCKNVMARGGESTFAYSDYSDPAPSKNAAVKISGNVYQANGEVSFNGQITSGDLIDWYGVSWSEDSSDPTCTRIGNMALHRSLPILSAMKGYYVSISGMDQETMFPITDDFTKVLYLNVTNTPYPISSEWLGNIMIKIPEFWYIDEYEPSTKTHNLKISQTAKAGWCHHKEAYVGAYEGYDDGTYYRSHKGQIPTVSKTREQLRTNARANGYEDEYKWNIYTYEEHRAICHLFLVEYATRNSQAPVNTALTSDGFKQGGLGPGCTIETMDGNYSFIPTGTTDSLGNGSGQVAYTASNGTTYYANRYRGIENPFGHIWKHVDDIISIYDSNSTYKTVYKCNKPEHFATNKNTKYKPLCSFPGGSKMQGWSKEIKATINCDFFKYSVGGNVSTYWCDYNYDNDDVAEHCLLIGGGSGDVSLAGLFYFTLDSSVDLSGVNIGSRLTYLPWAE